MFFITIFYAWLLRLNQNNPLESELLRACYHTTFQELLMYVLDNLSQKMELLECNYVKQVL